MFGYDLLTWSMHYWIHLEYVDYVLVCALYTWVFIPHFSYCGWEECNFLFWSFHVMWASLASISKHITGFFRFFGSKRSLWGSASYLSLLRIPFCLLYGNFHYLCYVLVFFVDLCIFCAHLCFVFCFCDFFDYGWEVVDFLFVAFFHRMLVSFSRLFI